VKISHVIWEIELEYSATFFLFAVPAVVFAGMSKGGFGSAASFAAAPFLALILEPAAAVGLMLPLLMLMDLGGLKAFWRQWDWPVARALIMGAVPGVVLASAVLGLTDPDVFRFAIGVIAVGFVLYHWARAGGMLRLGASRMSLWAGGLWGAVAGFTSFVSHAGGPPAAVFMLSRDLSKTSFQATTVLAFSAINVLKIGPYVALGMISTEMAFGWAVLAPFALAGVWLGVLAHRVVPERLYFRLTYIFLLITGTKLIWDALS